MSGSRCGDRAVDDPDRVYGYNRFAERADHPDRPAGFLIRYLMYRADSTDCFRR